MDTKKAAKFLNDRIHYVDMSVAEVSQQAGLKSHNTLYNFLKGKSDMTLSNWFRVMAVLDEKKKEIDEKIE